jgi:hypothetical protein
VIPARRRTAASFLFSAVCSVQAADLPPLPASPAQWRAAVIRDIEDGYRITLENHPGAVDPHNPGFPGKLREARAYALGLAQKVRNAAGYAAAINAFNVRIRDGHAGMASQLESGTPAKRWPGFVAAWRGDGLYVYAAENGSPAAGARIVSCDGKSSEQLMRDNLFSFSGRIAEAGQWWSRGRRLFSDDGNPFIRHPQRCVFQHQGRKSALALTWRAATPQAERWSKESYNGDVLPVGLTEPAPGLFWAAMPTFVPEEADRAAYRAMSAQVRQQRQRMLEAHAVVIDLRDNQGGSSSWSEDFAAALWGEARVKRRTAAYFARTQTWYRATPGNLAHFEALHQQSLRDKEAETAAWAREISVHIRAALARGEAFYVQAADAPAAPQAAGIGLATDAAPDAATDAATDAAADQAGDPPAFTRPVYVIVPGQCASACLDAIDTFKLFPNTRLIGAPSSADSTYMEVRLEKVPSGLSVVVVPTKLYVHRPRGNGEGYQPDIMVRSLVWSTAAFRRVIEQDLATGRPPAPQSASR